MKEKMTYFVMKNLKGVLGSNMAEWGPDINCFGIFYQPVLTKEMKEKMESIKGMECRKEHGTLKKIFSL